MPLTKLRRRFPLFEEGLPAWFDTSDLIEDEFFNYGKNVPAMNLKEEEKFFKVEIAVPGFSKDDIEISLENKKLHVTAKKSIEKEEEEPTGYIRKEFSYNEFERFVALPSFVDTHEAMKAKYHNGILKLTLPKKKEEVEAKKKLIEIA